MKKHFSLIIKSILLTVLFSGATAANAQSLSSILGGVIENVVGDKLTNESSIIGTWSYSGPDCKFTSDNFLAKAGGEVAALEAESKLQDYYEKIGFTDTKFTFNQDGTFSFVYRGRTTNGTYKFDKEAKTITMKTKLGLKFTGYTTVGINTMSLVFNADKLMTMLKLLSGAASSFSTKASTISSLAKYYDGMRLGFELKSNNLSNQIRKNGGVSRLKLIHRLGFEGHFVNFIGEVSLGCVL